MNIVFLINNYPGFGGIERVTQVLTERLHTAGLGVTILSLGTQAPELLDDCRRTGVPLVYVPNRQVMHCPENVAFLRRFFAEQPIDVVVYQDSYAPSDFILDEVDFPWEQRLIVAEHNTPIYSLINNRIRPRLPAPPLRRLLRWVLRPRRLQHARRATAERHGRLLARCRRYVLLSESFRPELLGLCGTRHADKVDVITNPLTIAPAPQGIFRKKRQILFVGALDPRKGLDYLLNIWKRFRARGYADWELLIAGRGPLEPHVRSRLEREHIAGVRLLGAVTDMAPLYEESAILMMTSIFEGIPLVLTEAMSRGCVPLAFASYASVHDLIDDGLNGELIPPFREQVYADKLCRLIDDPPRLQQMQREAVRKAHRFSPEAITEQWLALFRRVAETSA